MRIFITIPNGCIKDTFITKKVLNNVGELGKIIENPYDRQLSFEELQTMGKDADVLITGWGFPKIDESFVNKMPKLKIIAHTGASVATLVEPNVYKTGVKVLSGNDIFAKSVAEGCLCYTLAALRELEKYIKIVRDGGWRDEEFTNRGLIGKKVGLVGFGAIAKHFAQILKWFDGEILVYSGHLTADEAKKYGVISADLEEIFTECEVISIHAAMTPKTEGLISKELMLLMKKDALLVNTARGKIVDEAAMIELLGQKRFFAALDVFAEEPIPKDSPLRKMENALLIPHMGGPTIDMRENVTLSLIDDILNYQNDKEMKNEICLDATLRMSR